MDFENIRCPWGDNLKTCAITVCDTDGVIMYQNHRSREVNGDMRGRSMIPCHSARSRDIINRLMTTGATNAYTIQKNDLKKMIYQTAWKENGEVAGLVEISMVIPDEIPHYVR